MISKSQKNQEIIKIEFNYVGHWTSKETMGSNIESNLQEKMETFTL